MVYEMAFIFIKTCFYLRVFFPGLYVAAFGPHRKQRLYFHDHYYRVCDGVYYCTLYKSLLPWDYIDPEKTD